MFKFIQKMRPDAGTKKILIQFIAEFWLPFLIAAAWTAFGWFNDKKNYSILINGITNFFAAGWLFSQWNRIKKQKKSEDGLQSVQENINSLIVKLEASTNDLIIKLESNTNDLIGYATGGDSFCELVPTILTPLLPSNFELIHHGKYPLYDLQVRIIDLERFENISKKVSMEENFYKIDVLSPQQGIKIELYTPCDEMRSPHRRLNIFVTARNGSFEQLLQIVALNGVQRRATRFIKDEKVFNEGVDSDFPHVGGERVDWSLHDVDKKFRYKRDLT